MSDDLPIPAPTAKPIPDEGMHNAVLMGVADMGDVVDDFPGKPASVVHKVRFFFELEAKLDDGRPFMLSTKDITLSTHEKGNLFKLLKGWMGKDRPANLVGFPLRSLVGRAATITVEHVAAKSDGHVYAVIAAVGPMMPMATKLTVVNQTFPEWVEKSKAANAAKVAKFWGDQSDAPDDDQSVPF